MKKLGTTSSQTLSDLGKDESGDKYIIHSARRTLQALDLFNTKNSNIGVSELQQELGINSNMAFRILYTLEKTKYIILNPETGKYHLSLKVFAMGRTAAASISITKIASPYLQLLSASLKKVNVVMFVYEQGDLLIAEKIASNRLPKVYAHVGRIMPVHATAAGKVLVSELDEAELESVIKTNGLDNFTSNTITDFEAFKRELADVRTTQLAWEKEEHIQNLNGVAAAVRDRNAKIIAAVCINGFDGNVSVPELEQMTNSLFDTTYRISEAAGYMR